MASATTADGVRIDYEAMGTGDPPMVFVHGWSCDRSYFEPQVGHFGRTRHVASLDLRGHGTSALSSGGYSIEEFVIDVQAVAKAEGMDRPVVAGHSMGGVVALAAAAAGAARAAVLVDPAPITGGIVAMIAGMAEGFADDIDGTKRAAFCQGMFLPSDDPGRRASIVERMSARPLEVAVGAIRGIGEFDGPAALAACTVPILSIGSAVPSNSASDLRAGCKHIAIGQTVGAGHFHQLEVPDQVNAMIEKFLEISL